MQAVRQAIQSSRTIEIPLRESDEIIELELDSLPEADEVLSILSQERAQLSLWLLIAHEYYQKGNIRGFVMLLENAVLEENASRSYQNGVLDATRAHDWLAAYFMRAAISERSNADRRRELFQKATMNYNAVDRFVGASDLLKVTAHYVGRAYLCLYEGKLEDATRQFDMILNRIEADNVPALIGLATVQYRSGDYRAALEKYRRALLLYPVPTELEEAGGYKLEMAAQIRVGIGYCLTKLGKTERARVAFDRALQLSPRCVGAMLGVALIELNSKTPEGVKRGMQTLSSAYQIDRNHPTILNLLADHFFFKKDYQRCQQLSLFAFHQSESEQVRAISCYQVARCMHAQEDLEQAYQYYYQSKTFASPDFVLPRFGAGQILLSKAQLREALVEFEAVLAKHPNNFETIKIVGSLLAVSPKSDQRLRAKQYLKRVVEQFSDDIESWILLASLYESSEPREAKQAYETIFSLLRNNGVDDAELPPELLNNVAICEWKAAKLSAGEGEPELDNARTQFERALERCRVEMRQADLSASAGGEPKKKEAATNLKRYYVGLTITVRYNLARLFEASHELGRAEAIYKEILKENANYLDAYLRLGCIARDRGHFYAASDLFNEVLQIERENADAWTLLGNLHLAKQELQPAQKKFERIIQFADSKDDTYARLALGNVWLATLGTQSDKEKEKRHQDRALSIYRSVLKADERNIYATHGIGCVLAQKGYLSEARDVFSLVRESVAEFPDVWLNLAHISTQQGNHITALHIYESALRKLDLRNHIDLLLCIARAYYRNGALAKAKLMLQRARRIVPFDNAVLFALAFILKEHSERILADEHSKLRDAQTAVNDLTSAQRAFQQLSANAHDRDAEVRQLAAWTNVISIPRFSILTVRSPTPVDARAAAAEARHCGDLISQAVYHLARARRADEQERELVAAQLAEKAALAERQRLEESERLAVMEDHRRKLEEQRARYVEESRGRVVLVVEDANREKRVGGDGGESGAEGDEEGRRPGEKRRGRGSRKRKGEDGFLDDEERGGRRRAGGHKHGKSGRRRDHHSKNKRNRPSEPGAHGDLDADDDNGRSRKRKFISAEFVESSDDSSSLSSDSDDERPKQTANKAASGDEEPASRPVVASDSDGEPRKHKRVLSSSSSDEDDLPKKRVHIDDEEDAADQPAKPAAASSDSDSDSD